MSEIQVSALVSTYNSERYIKDCIEDLLSQSIIDKIEIIVVNSGSEQNESRVVRQYQKKYEHIHLIETPRESVYSSWNRAIRSSTGKYLSNCNVDDRHDKKFFELITKILNENPDKVLCYTDYESYKEKKNGRVRLGLRSRGLYSRERLLQGNFIGAQPVWRRSVHDEWGFFNEKFIVAGDYEFWLRISQKYDFRYLNKPLGVYLFRKDSLERKDGRKLCLKETKFIKSVYQQAFKENTIIKSMLG